MKGNGGEEYIGAFLEMEALTYGEEGGGALVISCERTCAICGRGDYCKKTVAIILIRD